MHYSPSQQQTSEFVLAMSLVIDFYLDDERAKERFIIQQLCTDSSHGSDELLVGYCREALRLNPQTPGVFRVVNEVTEVLEGPERNLTTVIPGDEIFVSLSSFKTDVSRDHHHHLPYQNSHFGPVKPLPAACEDRSDSSRNALRCIWTWASYLLRSFLYDGDDARGLASRVLITERSSSPRVQRQDTTIRRSIRRKHTGGHVHG